ncbi:baculoviral IAP repeat-containing protein 6-like isoform X2 [Argonauta hians]
MASTGKWFVGEDGCLSVGQAATGVTYHPTLNTIIVTTKAHTLKVYDVTSGCLLKESNLSATNTKSNKLKCMFLQEKDRIIICEGASVCARKDLNGVLLLDTALQTPVSKTEDLVKVELLLAEANQLFKSLNASEFPGIDYVDDFIKELERAIESSQDLAKATHKIAKWATVCIQLPHCALKTVCSNVVAEMKRLNQHRPGLSIAAAISNRLSYLLPSSLSEIGSGPVERSLMYSEAARRETFGKWPHMNYKWALPDPMAQAGFYHQPNSIGDDRAMCFTCNVCLVCWEPTDEPWSEHERHSTSCPFVKGEYTQNVPLLVTYATQPALLHGEATDNIECISTSSSKHFFATSTLNGNVVIWSTSRLLKKHCQFNLDPTEPVIAAKTGVQFEMELIPTVAVDSRHKHSRMDQHQKTGQDHCANQLPEESYSPECVAVNLTNHQEILLSDEFYTRDQKCSKQTRPSQDIKVHSMCMMEKPDHLMIESKGGGIAGEGGGGNEYSNGTGGECNVYPSTKYLSQPSLVCGVSLRKTQPSCNVLHHESELNADFSVKPDVQFMNKVNEVVSSDTLPPKIIPDLLDDCDNVTLLDRMVFLPFIIVVAIWHEKPSSVKIQDNNSKPTTSGNELSVPTLGSIAMTQDWGVLDPMFDSLPDTEALLVEDGPGSKPLVNMTNTLDNLDTKMSNSNSSMSDLSEANKSPSMDNLFKQTQPLLPNGHILQCVELPRNLQSETLKISSINLTNDGLYVIVVLSPINICDNYPIVIDNKNLSKANSPNSPNTQGHSVETASNLPSTNSISQLADSPACGTILIYRLNFDNDHVRIEETPVNSLLIPSVLESVVNLAVIPNEFMGQAEDEDSTAIDNHHSRSSEPRGLFGTILFNGNIKLWDLSTLTSVAQIEPEEGDKFTSLTCCAGLDRLSACTMGGKLHFYQLSEQNPAILEMSNCGIFNYKETLSDLDTTDAGNEENNEHQKTKQAVTEESLFTEPLTTEKLMRLHSLTEFENLMPRFSATVSPCWTEIQQEQQQRRHPQHLQQQGEATQHTRTWRLQPESNTWDEHLFELVLPRPCTVGHIDVKFTLLMNMYSSLPNIQVTLLKQNIGNIGKQQPPVTTDVTTSTTNEKDIITTTTFNSTSTNFPSTSNLAQNDLDTTNASQSTQGPSEYDYSIPENPEPFPIEVDQKLDFNLHPRPNNLLSNASFNGKPEVNNVLDPLFLEMLNAEILCGPLPVSSCLDLSGSSALVTLTSPQLLNSKSRSFLLHIKGFFTKGEDSPDKAQASESKKKSTTLNSTSMFDKQKVKSIKSLFDNISYPVLNTAERVSATPKMKLENIQGCDWIQELSITVRKTKKTRVPKERWHRNMMIESADFHENLLSAVTHPNQNNIHTSEDHHENLALDILCWVTAVQMNDPSRKIPDCTVLVTLKKELLTLVKACFIYGTRTTAHKASRLLVLCMELCKSCPDSDTTPSFSYILLQAILECLPLLPSGYSAGALRWFFTLLNIVKQMNDSLVAEKCVAMLTKVAKFYHNRETPLHSLLKARYGLQGHPFDPDLFDFYPANSLRQSAIPYTYASAVAGTPGGQSFQPPPQQDEMDYYDLFNQLSDKQCDKFPSEYLRHNILGLLEVEPLHFTCHATSDSTKMERLDSGPSNSNSIPIVGSSGLSGTVNFGESLSNVATSGATMASLPSSLAMAEQQVQQLATKVQQSKKDVESIKELLSSVLKTAKPCANSSTSQGYKQRTQNLKTTALLSPTDENWPVGGPRFLSPGVSTDNGPLCVKVPSLLGDKCQTSDKSDNKQRVQMVLSHLLQPPSPQVLVVERMHSGARRFVILDLGKPVLLTDVIIPACADLASLSIDVWVQSEETDGQRLVIASDIGIRSLIMNNIMPPPICRYLKITTIGRYGGSATRSKIPVGSFYGHSFIFPWEWNSYHEQHAGVSGNSGQVPTTSSPVGATNSTGQDHQQQQQLILSQLGLFLSLLEDFQCRYSLTKTQLDSLLTSLLASQSASDHVQCYLQKNPKKNVDDKITSIYNDCLQLQLQLNLCHHAIDRLQRGLGLSVIKKDAESIDVNEQLKEASTDKLRFLLECLLETLISTTNASSATPQLPVSLLNSLRQPTCESLFRHICISGTKRIQILTGMLLVRVCGTQQWWGKFLGNILQRFFHSEYKQVFPQDRVFVLLTALGQKSLMGPMAVNILESLLGMLVHAVAPLMPVGVSRMPSGSVDLTLVGWILLFLCRNLDQTMQNGNNGDDDKSSRKDKDNGTYLPNRWSFLQGDMSGLPNKNKVKQSMKTYRRCLQKRIFQHKQKLQDLEQAKKKFLASQTEKYSLGLTSEAKALFKEHEQQFKKISQYASKIRKTDGEYLRKMVKDDSCLSIGKETNDVDTDTSLILPRDKCLPVVRGLVTLILSMDSTCNVDLFLVASKVLARICLATRPAICLSEAMTQDQLQQLILLAANQDFNHGTVAWGGPWAGHAITCLLQDILDGERLYPTSTPLEGVTDDDMSAAANEKLDSMSASAPIPSLDAMAVEAIDASESEIGQTKESNSKTNLMDFLFEENEYEDDVASAKLQEFIVGVQSKPPPGLDCDEGSIPMLSVQSSDGNSTPDALASSYYPDEKKQKMKQCKSKFDYGKSLLGPQGLSAAVDFRLELGLQLQAELGLRVMLSYQMVSVQGAFNARLPLAPPFWQFFQPFQYCNTDDELSEIIQTSTPTQFQTTSSAGMLSLCYDHMTPQLLSQQVHLDTLLQLWLMLNEDSSHEDTGVSGGQPAVFDASKTPLIRLNPSFVNTLLEALSFMANIPVRTWVLAFQSLTLLCNQWLSHSSMTAGKPMASVILSNSNFMNVMKRFLSSSTNTGPSALTLRYQQVGPSAAKAFYEFLQRLEVKAPEQRTLKELLLKLVYVLTADRGAFYSGPLDVQCRFLDFVLCLKYEQVDVSNAISVVEAISSLVHQHILSQELVVCRKAGEEGINARLCFCGLFASHSRGVDTSSNAGDASRDKFMCSLVKLVNTLVQIPLPSRFSRNPSQTDSFDSTSTHHLSSYSATNLTTAPMPDSAKLSHVFASSTLRNLSRSDDEKEQETIEDKGIPASSGLGGQPAGDLSDNTTYLADIIVGHQQIMSSLIHTLSYCSSNPMASRICNGIGASSSYWYDTFGIGEPLSVGDGVYQILVTLTNKCSDIKLVLESLFVYLSGGGRQYVQGHSLCRLSDPLLWFILKVLNNSNTVKMFLQMGAIDVICNNLVSCSQKIVNTSPGLISTMMQNLNNSNNSRIPSAHRINVNSSNNDCNDVLQNFAPLGSISSSSPTATPAEVLIQASPPHRRARSAAWSYHFYPDQTWVDLTIQLPFAILLKEVQISPHNTSLSTCPSYVSLEISHDGITVTPMSAPLMTCSLGFIRLQLIRPEVVTLVTIRLHRARDSMTIGLSQILLMGHSAFSETNQKPASILAPTDDVVSKTSLGWVQLLQHCLTVEESIASAAAAIPHLLTTCTALLVSPQASTHSHYLETVLLKLGLHSTDMGLTLIDSLLRKPSYLGQPDDSVSFMGKVSGIANDSTIEILYQLGTLQDTGTTARLKALIKWLGDSAEVALQKSEMLSLNNGYGSASHETSYFTLPHPAAPHVHCIAAILWYSQSLPVHDELCTIITQRLFRSIYEWSTVLSFDSSLKRAVDNVLCSICYIYPSFFTLILEWMGILLNPSNSMTASISDDCKDSSQQHISMTDDSKEAQTNQQSASSIDQHFSNNLITLHDFSNMMLDRSHLSTLAITCQSPGAVQQLLASKFPATLAQGLFEFCNHEIACFAENLTDQESLTDASKSMMGENDNSANGLTVTADLVAAILGFFAEITREPMIKDWMGSPEGSIFWPVLLTLLCTIPVQAPRTSATPQTAVNYKHKMMTAEERAAIETVVITFFNQVISCHSQNQHLFAQVLCEVIKEQGSGPISSGPFLSGFTRRMFLQVLLEEPKILVSFRSSPHNSRLQVQGCFNQLQHPCFGAGRHFHTVTVGLQTNCEELINKISDHTGHMAQLWDGTVEKKNVDDNKKDMTELDIEVVDLSNAAGLLAKERREKNSNHKTGGPPRLPPRARGNQNTDMVAVNLHFPVLSLYHNLLPGQPLPAELTLSQLLDILQEKGYPQGQAVLEFLLRFHSKPGDKKAYRDLDWPEANNPDDLLLKAKSFLSALQVFASVGGLALLAEHLPVLYSEVSRQPVLPDTMESTAVTDVSQDQWVSVDSSDLNETFYEPASAAPPTGSTAHSGLSTIPPHSLIAFRLFLRLPGYADVLLLERKKAQCLLRLVLGVTDDGDGGHILTSPIANSLPTLPFNVIESLFDKTPLTTDDGVYLRRKMLDIGALHLILACLSVLSHHGPRVNSPALQHETMLNAIQVATTQTVSSTAAEEKSQQYWAKGTGFGTGSTTSSWDAEQSLLRQKSEEEHVTCLLQVIASYINPRVMIPGGAAHPSQCHNLLPEVVPELLSLSCLVPAISSYLRNDSVLDMARHIPLYKALLELLRGIAICPMLVPLLLPLDKSGDGEMTVSVCTLLEKMRGCVDTYANRLKSNKTKGNSYAAANNAGNGSGPTITSKEEEEENEGLAKLIPNIQETARIVQMATDKLKGSKGGSAANKGSRSEDKSMCSNATLENRYINVMKQFQFETYEMVTENDNFMKFTTPHHYESNVRTSGFIKNPSRARRLAQEAVTLSTSLPLSASSSVFVRCDEDRLDIMKVLITGPADTPYANGCFEFDVYFPQDYPVSPPFINLETTGNHSVRFNPNLYNDGKVCLSVLNTWHGRPEEKWNPQTSSFLQVLVSIQSLILVSEPYFNEPGYERSRGTPSGTASSREYDANIRQATVKWAMLEQIRDPSPCFKEVIQNHFWLKRHEILSQCEQWMCEMESYSHDKRTGRHIAHSTLALKRHYNHLREEFSKMDPPSGMEGEVADIPEETKPEFSHSKSYIGLDVEEGPTQVEPINLDITDPISVLESLPFGPNSIDC